MLYLADPDGNVTQLTSGEYEVRSASLSRSAQCFAVT
jgi:hypothetical protein